MKIVVDMNHPSDVHLFRNFISVIKGKGHEVMIIASNKEITYELLDNYGIDYVAIGSLGKSLISKLINLPILELKMYSAVRNFKPDIFIGLGAIRAAHISRLMGKPCIILTDTEHSKEQYYLYAPFVKAILTPSWFKEQLGPKQVRYEGCHQLAYLHPNYFKPNSAILDGLGLSEDEKLIIVRFVAWNATHDVWEYGIKDKSQFIDDLEGYGRVLITSESKLRDGLEKYRISAPPKDIFSLLYYSDLYIGEGGTMAIESALLGTPSIFISTLAKKMGSFGQLQNKYGLVFSYEDSNEAMAKAKEILSDRNSKDIWKSRRDKLLEEKIDVTAYIVDYVENLCLKTHDEICSQSHI